MLLPALQTSFAEQWALAWRSAEFDEERQYWVWMEMRDAWLRTKEGKSNSRHTRRSYELASAQWFEFVASLADADGRPLRPWEATSEHVRLWQAHLERRGLAPASVNQRLAAASSFYGFVARERAVVNGVEISPLTDRLGRQRENPFLGGNIQRARIKRYGHARILSPVETQQLMSYLDAHSHTITGSRNHALILTYLLTGYRNSEVVGLRWGAIRPNRNQAGAWIIEWQGKGGKRQADPCPARVYHAIVNHLSLSGRPPGLVRPSDCIFVPLRVAGLRNLRNNRGEPGAHISPQQAETILRTALRLAGVDRPDEVRVHDLRHTFAQRFRRANPDLEALRARLHHESLATTGIYAREVLDDPADDYSEDIYRGLLEA